MSAHSQTQVGLRKIYRLLFVSCDRRVWTAWQTVLQQRRTERVHEDLALQQFTISVQSRVSVCLELGVLNFL